MLGSDRLGRKSMLVLTLFIMGLSTFCIGLLPTYASIGVLAPILLILLRIIQGIGLGGEWGGATLMTVEHSPASRRHFYASWPQVGSPAGLILSTTAFGAFSSLSDPQFFAWGWRVPLLAGCLIIPVLVWLSLRAGRSEDRA